MNHFKRKLTAFTAMLAFLSLSSVALNSQAHAMPGNVLDSANAHVYTDTTDPNLTHVNNTSGRGGTAVVNWDGFNVAQNEQVNFGFSNISQTTINRVLGGSTSEILGRLTSSCINQGSCGANGATGKVLLINPAGVLFGQGSQVDINSFATSTFDIKGAKRYDGNLQNVGYNDLFNMPEGDNIANYLKHINMKDKNGNDISYDFLQKVDLNSNYIDGFVDAVKKGDMVLDGVSATSSDAEIRSAVDNMIQKSGIKLNGATFTHFAKTNGKFDFTKEAGLNENKSLAFVSNNIEYKDSLIRTGDNFNYKAGGKDYSYSNVKLITADGVTFNYLAMGYIDSHKVSENDNHPELARTITMDNGLYKNTATAGIIAGEVDIEQRSQVANGTEPSVKIKDTIIKGTKLVNRENGDIAIIASQDVLVDHSRLQTTNRTEDPSTTERHGGEVYIRSNKNVTVKDSTIITAGSEGTADYAEYSGAIRILSGEGTAKVEGSKLLADGHTQVKSGDKVVIDNSIVQAYNTVDTTEEKDVTIVGANGVTMNNTDSNSKGHIIILAGDEETGKLTGDVNISADDTKSIAENDANQPVLKAKKSISIQGKNTTISDVTLAYDESEGLKFYDSTKDGDDYVNNVTIKNGTAFTPYNVVEGKDTIANDVTIKTNGDLTFNNATAKRAKLSINFDRKDSDGNTGYNLDSTNKLNDDGTIDGIRYRTLAVSDDNNTKADAVNLNIESTKGNVTIENGSKINATNNLTVNAAKDYTQNGASNMTAGNDVKVAAGYNASVNSNSVIEGGHDASVEVANANINVENAQINAKSNKASLTANKGAVTVANSKVEAGNDVDITAKNNIVVANSNVTAGSDAEGFDANDTAGADGTGVIGDVNITSTNGSVNIKHNSKVISQDKDVNITAYNTISFGNEAADNIDNTADITGLHNVNITSTNGNIEGEKTTMPTIQYGDRLTFDANKSNIFTSQDSLKSVNVDYKAGVSNQIYTQGDAQFVNSSFEAPNNFVESGKDVILNNLEINVPEGKAPEEVTTQIFANGNVTTHNVTDENLGAKNAEGYHEFPQSVDTNRVVRNSDETIVDYNKRIDALDKNKDNPGKIVVNDTKLKVTTRTEKKNDNPDNGSITLVLQNADNTNAGVELDARNVASLDTDPTGGYFKEGYYLSGTDKWDENVDSQQGPEIVLASSDGKIAVKELYSDKLTLPVNEKIFADDTDGTPVITIKDQGGFSRDPELDYQKDPDGNKIGDGYTYTETRRSTDLDTTRVIDFPDFPDEWTLIDERQDAEGNIIRTYERTRDGEVTTTTVKIDQEHKIVFDNNNEPSEFILVYDKKDTTIDKDIITAQQVKDDKTILDDIKKPDGSEPTPDDFIETDEEIEECDPTPVDDDRADAALETRITLPRQGNEISYASAVADNTADQTANIMSAAAKIDLSSDAEASYSDDDDDDWK